MFRLLIRAIVWLVRAGFQSREDLVLENLALRQQLAIFKEKLPRPKLPNPARAFWVGLRSAWPRWRNSLILVNPDTVVGWHRKGFRLFWRLICIACSPSTSITITWTVATWHSRRIHPVAAR